jgi:hypothetical protein
MVDNARLDLQMICNGADYYRARRIVAKLEELLPLCERLK